MLKILLWQYLNALREYNLPNSIDSNRICWLEDFLQKIPYFAVTTIDFPPSQLKRLTINDRLPNNNNERINFLRELKYPPAESVQKFGRANLKQQSVFYSSFACIDTTMEMRPKIGQLVTVSEWKLKKEIKKIKLCPIFKKTSLDNIVHNPLSLEIKLNYENYIKSINDKDIELIEIITDFLSEVFSKRVDHTNDSDYFLSAYFANKIFSLSPDIEGIIYPSVINNLLSSNVVLKPETLNNKFDLISVEEMMTKSITNFRQTGFSDSYDLESGTIFWK